MVDDKIIRTVKQSVASEEVDPNVQPAEGIKMKSPDGTVWYVSVTDTGEFSAVEVV